MKTYDENNMQVGDIAIVEHSGEFYSFKIGTILQFSNTVYSEEGDRFSFDEIVEVIPTSRPVRTLGILQNAYGFQTDPEIDELFTSLHNMNVENLQRIAVDNNDRPTFDTLGGMYQ